MSPPVGWSKISTRALLYSQAPEGWYPALADWVECQAILYPGVGCSRSTLETALKTSHWESPFEDFQVLPDEAADEAFTILSDRHGYYKGHGYPFTLQANGPTLHFDATLQTSAVYLFLLGLSYCHPNKKSAKLGGRTGAYLLEALAWLGMQRLLGDPLPELKDSAIAHHLGAPSLSNLPGRFDKKITAIIADIREGGSYKPLPSGHIQKSGENGVDLFFRRGFRDTKGAQLIILGACAAGQDWASTKRYECNPNDWFERNYTQRFLGTNGTARFFTVPRELPIDGWESTARAGGMMLDRCRLSYLTHLLNNPTIQQIKDWTKYNIA